MRRPRKFGTLAIPAEFSSRFSSLQRATRWAIASPCCAPAAIAVATILALASGPAVGQSQQPSLLDSGPGFGVGLPAASPPGALNFAPGAPGQAGGGIVLPGPEAGATGSAPPGLQLYPPAAANGGLDMTANPSPPGLSPGTPPAGGPGTGLGPVEGLLPSQSQPPAYNSLEPPPYSPYDQRPTIASRLESLKENVFCDYAHYYSVRGLVCLAGGFAVAAPFANTQLDQQFRDWYQSEVRSSGTDRNAYICKQFGEGEYMIPAAIVAGVVGNLWDDEPVAGVVGDWGGRVTRAYLVGGPPMLFFQYALGGYRPSDNLTSYWKPFSDTRDVSVSGHAFVGSVPFITAAQMTDNPLLKGCFYFISVLPGWSRINDDAHYLSQVGLGWYMGYLACEAVDETNHQNERFRIAPLATPDMVGIGLTYRH